MEHSKNVSMPLGHLLELVADEIGKAMADGEAARHYDLRRLAMARTSCEQAALWAVAAQEDDYEMVVSIARRGR